MMCFMGVRLAQEFVVELLDLGIVVGLTDHLALILGVQSICSLLNVGI